MSGTEPAPLPARSKVVATMGFAVLFAVGSALTAAVIWGLARFIDTGETIYALVVIAACLATLTMPQWLTRPLIWLSDRFLRSSTAT